MLWVKVFKYNGLQVNTTLGFQGELYWVIYYEVVFISG